MHVEAVEQMRREHERHVVVEVNAQVDLLSREHDQRVEQLQASHQAAKTELEARVMETLTQSSASVSQPVANPLLPRGGEALADMVAALDTLQGKLQGTALEPELERLRTVSGAAAAAKAARKGAEATARMKKARAGRSTYVGGDRLAGYVDPGAEAVARAFEAVARTLSQR